MKSGEVGAAGILSHAICSCCFQTSQQGCYQLSINRYLLNLWHALGRLLGSAEKSGAIKQTAFPHKELIGWLREMRHGNSSINKTAYDHIIGSRAHHPGCFHSWGSRKSTDEVEAARTSWGYINSLASTKSWDWAGPGARCKPQYFNGLPHPPHGPAPFSPTRGGVTINPRDLTPFSPQEQIQNAPGDSPLSKCYPALEQKTCKRN